MIDLHTHVLPGVDDGASDWPAAVAMCRRAYADGVRGLVATPHFFRGLFPTPEVAAVHGLLVQLRDMLARRPDAQLQLYLGGDCHLHPEVVENVLDGRAPTLNSSRYLLLELPNNTLPPALNELVFKMSMNHITPIITHPERNEVLARHPRALYELINGGALAQVTAGSLTGFFGSSAREAAELMMANGLVQIIASDGHDPERRAPVLSEGVEAARSIVGDDLANRMVDDVPRAILEDAPVEFPDPLVPRKQTRSFFGRLFRG